MDDREMRLECAKLAGGDVDRAREMYDFICGRVRLAVSSSDASNGPGCNRDSASTERQA